MSRRINIESIRQLFHQYTNEHRTKMGRNPVKYAKDFESYNDQHSHSMGYLWYYDLPCPPEIRHLNSDDSYIHHNRPARKSFNRSLPNPYAETCENAGGFFSHTGDEQDVYRCFTDFINSPPHRENIEGRSWEYHSVGVYETYKDGYYLYTITHTFMRRGGLPGVSSEDLLKIAAIGIGLLLFM